MELKEVLCKHSDRTHHALNMCFKCYDADWHRKKRRKVGLKIPAPRMPRINSCGHTDAKHKAYGMCRPCYDRWSIEINGPRKYTKDYIRDKGYRARYGISLKDYEDMYRAQKGLCAVCFKEVERPYVDHNHDNGKIRGLVHPRCNNALGAIGDNVEFAKQLISYLKGK